MRPVFVLGLGAMKAGSTWLYECLHSQDYADFGFCKEYYVWDAVSGLDVGINSVVKIKKGQDASNVLR